MSRHHIDRRTFLKTCGKVALAAPLLTETLLLSGCARCVPHKRNNEIPQKIVLQNGSVFMGGRYRRLDMEIQEGKIIHLADRILALPDHNTNVMDCSGLHISPGWVDLHCHIGTTIGIEPCLLGPQMGVTALVEAGTYGPETLPSFFENCCPGESIPVYLFLNVRKNGIQVSNVLFKSRPGVEDVEGARRLAMEYPDIIKGFKVRLDTTNTPSGHPTFLAETTAKLAADLSMPVMYHLGNPEPSITDFLKVSKPGDIITHFLRETNNCVVLPSGAIRPEAREAKANGVLFDVGHGLASFRFETARKALEQDFSDFTISSDLWILPSLSKSLTFANVASKFLALGLSLEDVTRKISSRPREILQIESEIQVGKKIDLTLFSIQEGEFAYSDTGGEELKYNSRIMPRYTVVNGEMIHAGGRDQQLFTCRNPEGTFA
ncbi:MAG: hypothetical protein C4522_17345 [Desulfobacteraceae bacterium]|nr:MAG: hypothetical protein C4522_17345 [Desulfobacteraceae bacterium]